MTTVPHARWCSQRSHKRMRFSGNIVTVKVGRGRNIKEFKVHETLIKAQSEFFRAALDKKWQEGQDLVLNLVEDKPDVFNAYLRWIYNETIDLTDYTDPKRDQPWAFLAHLYVFGEKTLDDIFCNYVADEMCRQWNSRIKMQPGDVSIEIIYTGTSAQAPIRNLLVAIYVGWLHESWFSSRLNAEFVLDCARAFAKMRTIPQPPDDFHPDNWHILKRSPSPSSGKSGDPNTTAATASASASASNDQRRR